MNSLELIGLIEFVSKYSDTRKQEQSKLPYHLNVIDQLHINENGHSRVLMHLLSYKNEDGQYDYLISLLDLIKEKQTGDFCNITIVSPKITQEKERIDLWIRDENYAIIFENKIYNAADQEAQISRYIKKTKEGKRKYKEEDIYIVYLSQYPKEPESQSWGEYKESFRSRYVNLSYCYDILPWLKDKVLPNIKSKELFLQTAIIQYVDYLEGLFKSRKIEEPMNNELKKLIIEQFGLSEKNEKECISFLREKSNDFNEITQQMNKMIDEYRNNIYETWKKKTEENYSGLSPNKKSEAGTGWPITDVTFDNIDGKSAIVYIGCDGTRFYSGFYFDFDQSDEDRKLQGPIIEKLMGHLSQTNDIKKQMFASFDNDQFDEVYQHFEETIAIVKNYDN